MQLACIRPNCYGPAMGIHLQIRDVPDDLHQILRRRADARGLSLRQYALEVLREHCQRPTLDEWLDGLGLAASAALPMPAAEALRQAREADEDALAHVLGRP